MSDTLHEDEWLRPSQAEKNERCVASRSGHCPVGVSGASLEFNDCLALVLAEDTRDCMLQSGYSPLRGAAKANGIEVHGVATLQDLHDACFRAMITCGGA